MLIKIISVFCFLFISSYAYEVSFNPANVEGYITIEKHGVLKHYIVENSENHFRLILIKEDNKKNKKY